MNADTIEIYPFIKMDVRSILEFQSIDIVKGDDGIESASLDEIDKTLYDIHEAYTKFINANYDLKISKTTEDHILSL